MPSKITNIKIKSISRSREQNDFAIEEEMGLVDQNVE